MRHSRNLEHPTICKPESNNEQNDPAKLRCNGYPATIRMHKRDINGEHRNTIEEKWNQKRPECPSLSLSKRPLRDEYQ